MDKSPHGQGRGEGRGKLDFAEGFHKYKYSPQSTGSRLVYVVPKGMPGERRESFVSIVPFDHVIKTNYVEISTERQRDEEER